MVLVDTAVGEGFNLLLREKKNCAEKSVLHGVDIQLQYEDHD